MNIKFQNVRNYLAGLVGKPDLPVAMAAELDSAIKADEASIEEVLANSSPQTATTEAVVDTPTAIVPEVAKNPEKVAGGAADTTTEVSASSDSLAELINKKFLAMETKFQALEAAHKAVVAENADLRAAGSPRGVVPTTENSVTGKGRVSRTSEKDEHRIAEITRLKEIYPELMQDIE
ncbi:MAG: hypothetical protein MUF12_00500 [Sediminibacterium sp.]|jgi:hypothetical protein|nr:hypothetical protein [Sediminibacterium sp.]